MRSPLAVNRPHTTQQVVNWRKGRGRAAKNAIRRMHEWLKCAVLIDPIAEKRREILQNLDVFQVETTSYEVTEEEKARRAELLRKQKQEREVKEKARKEAQQKAAQEKARKREEDEKKRKAAEEVEHRKWQEQMRKQEEDAKKQKEEEERLKKEKKAKTAQEENTKQEKAKKDKQSKSKRMSECEKTVPVEEPVEVVIKKFEQPTAPEQKQEKQSESESATVVQDVPLEAAAPEESKSSKKNTKNKKVSESEPVAGVQKQTVVEATPVAPVEDAGVATPVEKQSEKKSKKNKKDKKHSESEQVVEKKIETTTETAPTHVEENPAAEQKADKKSKKNENHTESERKAPAVDVEEPCVAIIVQPSNETENATVETTTETHSKKADKKKNKRHSESEKTNGHLPNGAPASHVKQNRSAVHETAVADATPAPPQNDESLDFLDFVTAKPAKEENAPVLPTPAASDVVASAASAQNEDSMDFLDFVTAKPKKVESTEKPVLPPAVKETSPVAHKAPAQNEDSLDFLDFVTAKPEKVESTAKPVLPPDVNEASPVVEQKSPAPAQNEDSLDFLDFVTAKPEKVESTEKPVLPPVVKETSPVEERADKKSKKNKKDKKNSEGEQVVELKYEGKVEATPVEEAPAVAVEEEKSDKKSKKNKKDKKHSESEKTVDVKKETTPEAAPTAIAETVSVDDKKSKKNKKDKKHSESEKVVKVKTDAVEAVKEASSVDGKADKKSKKNKKDKKILECEQCAETKVDTPVETTPPAVEAHVEEKSDKKSKKNMKDKKHSESEPVAEVKTETVVEAAPVAAKKPSPAPIAEEKSDKKSKKNKKDKKHSESEKVSELSYQTSATEQMFEAPVEVAPVTETPVAAVAEEKSDKKSKKNKKDKKHSESEKVAEHSYEAPAAPVTIEVAAPVEEKAGKKSKKNKKDKKHSESEHVEVKTEVPVQEAPAPVVDEKSDKKSKKNKKDKKHSEPEAAHMEETQHVPQPASTTESAPATRATTDDSMDFLDFVSTKVDKEVVPAPASTPVTTATPQPVTDDSLDFLDFVSPNAEMPADSTPAASSQPVGEESLDFLDFVTSKSAPHENTGMVSSSLPATLMSKNSLFGHSAEKPQHLQDVVVTYTDYSNTTSTNTTTTIQDEEVVEAVKESENLIENVSESQSENSTLVAGESMSEVSETCVEQNVLEPFERQFTEATEAVEESQEEQSKSDVEPAVAEEPVVNETVEPTTTEPIQETPVSSHDHISNAVEENFVSEPVNEIVVENVEAPAVTENQESVEIIGAEQGCTVLSEPTEVETVAKCSERVDKHDTEKIESNVSAIEASKKPEISALNESVSTDAQIDSLNVEELSVPCRTHCTEEAKEPVSQSNSQNEPSTSGSVDFPSVSENVPEENISVEQVREVEAAITEKNDSDLTLSSEKTVVTEETHVSEALSSVDDCSQNLTVSEKQTKSIERQVDVSWESRESVVENKLARNIPVEAIAVESVNEEQRESVEQQLLAQAEESFNDENMTPQSVIGEAERHNSTNVLVDSVQSFVCVEAPVCENSENETSVEHVDEADMIVNVDQEAPAASDSADIQSENVVPKISTVDVSENTVNQVLDAENATETSPDGSVNQEGSAVVSESAETTDSTGVSNVFVVEPIEKQPQQSELEVKKALVEHERAVENENVSESIEEKADNVSTNISVNNVTEAPASTDMPSAEENYRDYHHRETLERSVHSTQKCTQIVSQEESQEPGDVVQADPSIEFASDSAQLPSSEDVSIEEDAPATKTTVISEEQIHENPGDQTEKFPEYFEVASEISNVAAHKSDVTQTEGAALDQQHLEVIVICTGEVGSSERDSASNELSGANATEDEQLFLPMSEKEQFYFNTASAVENVAETPKTNSAVEAVEHSQISAIEVPSSGTVPEERQEISPAETWAAVGPSPLTDGTASVAADHSLGTMVKLEEPQEIALESYLEAISNDSTLPDSVRKPENEQETSELDAAVSETNNVTSNTDNEQTQETVSSETESEAKTSSDEVTGQEKDTTSEQADGNDSVETSEQRPSISEEQSFAYQGIFSDLEISHTQSRELHKHEFVVEAFAELNLDKFEEHLKTTLPQIGQEFLDEQSHDNVLKNAVSTETLTEEQVNIPSYIEASNVEIEAENLDNKESGDAKNFADAQETLDEPCSRHMVFSLNSVEETTLHVTEEETTKEQASDADQDTVSEEKDVEKDWESQIVTDQKTSASEVNDSQSESQVREAVQEQVNKALESVQSVSIFEESSKDVDILESVPVTENESVDSREIVECPDCPMSVSNVYESQRDVDIDDVFINDIVSKALGDEEAVNVDQNECLEEQQDTTFIATAHNGLVVTHTEKTAVPLSTETLAVIGIENLAQSDAFQEKSENPNPKEILEAQETVTEPQMDDSSPQTEVEKESVQNVTEDSQTIAEAKLSDHEECMTENIERAYLEEIEPVLTKDASAHDPPNREHEVPSEQIACETVNKNENPSVEFAILENICEPAEFDRESPSPVSYKPVFVSAVTMEVVGETEQEISQNFNAENHVHNESPTEIMNESEEQVSESHRVADCETVVEYCEKPTVENDQSEVAEESAATIETNKSVEVRRSSESLSEFVISYQGSETVAQEHDTVVTVVVTEAPPSAETPAETTLAPESTPIIELNAQNSVEESFTKVDTDVVNAAPKDDYVQKEEADSTGGKSKNKKKNKKNLNSKSITEQTEVSITDLDKSADAEIAALNKGSISPPIQVNEISSTEHTENGHKETIETIISQHVVDQKDVSPTRFAQNVQALVERTLKQTHPGAEIDPNVKMQIDIQLQRLAARRPVVEARNVITPLPLQLHISRPTTPANRERMYKLLPKDIIFCSSLIEAHGENYNAMAANPLNIYRENARGLQRKIRIFKESPHFQTYLKAKEEGITVEAMLAAESAH